MGLPSSRFLPFFRLVLLPPLLLLTLTCLYTSSTLRPFNDKHHLSFSQDVQCFSCESSSLTARSFLSLANFPASSYIRDVVLRHNVLNVEDSRGETQSKPISRRDTNDVESVLLTGSDNVRDDVHPHPDTTSERVREEISHPRQIIPQQESFDQKPIQRVSKEDVPSVGEERSNSFPSDEQAAETSKLESFVHGDSDGLLEKKIDDSVPSENEVHNSVGPSDKSSDGGRKEDNYVDRSLPEEKNVDRSVEVVDSSPETKEADVDSSVPEDEIIYSFVKAVEARENVEGRRKEEVNSSAQIVEVVQGMNENLDGGLKEEDRQLENRHLTSDDHASPEEHADRPIESNTSFTEKVSEFPVEQPTPLPVEIEEMKFRHENMSYEYKVAAVAVQRLMEAIAESALPKEKGRPSPDADEGVNLLLRGGLPQGVPLPEGRSCEGRQVFVYNLPSKFNVDLSSQCDKLLHWFNFCDYFVNEGMGSNVPTDELNDRGEKVLVPDGSWFLTHQYSLELIFHARLQHYPCLTTDINQANLFFVPYYAGLDVIRWHFLPNATDGQRDELTNDLLSWLEGQQAWSRNDGMDHVFVLGKIGWDFRRSDTSKHWGSKLLNLEPMWSPTKLLIERHPWHENDVGVPHPTFFHPKDDNEIRTWLAHVEHSERRYFVSFAGMPRPKMQGNVRGHLIQQCLDHQDDCFLLRCEKTICLRPDSTMNLFLHSHFCMQPPGDSPTRRSVFDSLIGGCIPVLFDPFTAYYQYPWHLPQNASSYSVFIPGPDVMSGRIDIVERLKSISPEERTAMRMRIIREIIPGLLYSQPGTEHSDFRDAFDISIEALLQRVANLRAEKDNSM